jgi:hypothetical protein
VGIHGKAAANTDLAMLSDEQIYYFSAAVGIQTPALWIESSIGGAENPGVCRSICLPLVNYT